MQNKHEQTNQHQTNNNKNLARGAFLCFGRLSINFTCGLVPKFVRGVSNFSGKELPKSVVDLQVMSPRGTLFHEGHANHIYH